MELFSAEKYRGKRVCVALSGGIDSVCLLHAFKARTSDMGITLSAVHVEHGLRGEESLRDMDFCIKLCDEWGIPLKIVRADVRTFAAENGIGVEEGARAVRYGVFRGILEGGEADLVATAHHADDVAETLLFRLARGTGLSGMQAITERGGIVRPLLACTRAAIEAYADENGLYHVEDSTNKNENFARNYIRHTALPAFEKIHEGAKENLVRFAALAAEEDAFLRSLAEEKIVRVGDEERVPVDLPDVLFRRACLACMRQNEGEGYTRANLEEIASLRGAQGGKKVALPAFDGVKRYAFREGNDIVFAAEHEAPSSEIPFSPVTGQYLTPATFSVQEVAGLGLPDARGAGELYVDLDAFPEGCVVRTRREGDVFIPYHARRMTLKKFLTNRKIPARVSHRLPVIARGEEVLVVVGVEIADSVKITEQTKRRGIVRC